MSESDIEEDPLERIKKLASESAVVIFSNSSCCMCHSTKKLLCVLGVNSTVHELDVEDRTGKEIERAPEEACGQLICFCCLHRREAFGSNGESHGLSHQRHSGPSSQSGWSTLALKHIVAATCMAMAVDSAPKV